MDRWNKNETDTEISYKNLTKKIQEDATINQKCIEPLQKERKASIIKHDIKSFRQIKNKFVRYKM